LIEVQVDRVGMVPESGAMSIFLKDLASGKVLVIQVGVFEGSAILYGMSKVSVRRPMTHDLLTTIIRDLGGEVRCLVIHDLVDNTYYGEIRLKKGGEEVGVDSRPSDGIALCLRAGAPIYVSEKLSEHFIDEMDILMASSGFEGPVH
jgi:bifunctional DNase/RNase